MTIQRQLTIVVLSLFALLLVYEVCAFFADVLRVLGISLLFSYLFISLVDWLTKYLRARAAAVLIVYTTVFLGTALGALFLVPAIMNQVTQLLTSTYDQLPQLVDGLTKAMTPIEKRLHAAQIELRTIDIVNGLLSNIPKLEAGMFFSRMSDVAFSTMTMLMYGLSIFVVSFYFLLDGYRMQAAVIRLFPKRHEKWLQDLALEIDKSMQAFFRGQLVLGLGFGALMVFVFSLFGVHQALLLGLILGIWEIIPVIGPPIGFIPVLVSVGIQGMDNVHLNPFSQVLIIFLVFQGLQWLKDNIVAPRYIGNVIGLHPVVIFIAIMIGAKLDGMLGIIFAIPAACAINVIVNYWHLHPSLTLSYGEASAAENTSQAAGPAPQLQAVMSTPTAKNDEPGLKSEELLAESEGEQVAQPGI